MGKTKLLINNKEYSLQEAKELYKELKELFEGKELLPYPVYTYPVYTYPYTPITNPDYVITYSEGVV
jgi:hypothetical protein